MGTLGPQVAPTPTPLHAGRWMCQRLQEPPPTAPCDAAATQPWHPN